MTDDRGTPPGASSPFGTPRRQSLTVTEVAAMLRLSKMSVYRLVHSGRLSATRIGKTIRITRSAVQDLLDNQPSVADTPAAPPRDGPSSADPG